ncbi:6b-interacting protein [Arachis hypogaea]|nr:6b-interacting protein [Arachis hypogaea]
MNGENFLQKLKQVRNKEQLALLQANGSSPTDDAYIKLFRKEHPGHVRGIGFGVCLFQVMKSANSFGGVSSLCNHDFDMAKVRSMEVELQENKVTISLLQV